MSGDGREFFRNDYISALFGGMVGFIVTEDNVHYLRPISLSQVVILVVLIHTQHLLKFWHRVHYSTFPFNWLQHGRLAR